MGIEISNPNKIKFYFRSVEVCSEWQCTTEKTFQVREGTRLELSSDGVNPYGSVSSFPKNNGGSWDCESWHQHHNVIEVLQELPIKWLEIVLLGK